MKSLILISIVLTLLLPSSALAQSTGGTVGIGIIKHDPVPAEAGKFLEVWLGVTKTGNNNLRNYVVEIVPEFPFFLAAGGDSTHEFAVIDSNGAVAKYELRVAEDAPNGDAKLKVRHYVKGSAPTGGGTELAIPILGKVDITINSITPDSLIPGQPTKVTFTVENTGEAPVRDLVVAWNDPKKSILPLAGENRLRIDNMKVGETKKIVFDMIADPSADQGVEVIDVNMAFQRFGIFDNRTSQIAFIVGGLTSFDVAQDEINEDTLSFSIANIGINSATGVLLSVPEQPGWTILGSSNVFLGNLESGDFTVGSVDVTPTSRQLRQTIDVAIDYTDTVGIRRNVEKEVVVNLSNILTKEDGNQSPLPAVIVIVVLIVGFWLANRKFKILNRVMHRGKNPKK